MAIFRRLDAAPTGAACGGVPGARQTFDASSVSELEAARGAREYATERHGADDGGGAGAAAEPAGMQALLQQLEAADMLDEDICD